MKIAYLANLKWVHTVNWVNGLAKNGHDVHLISMHSGVDSLSNDVTLHKLPLKAPLGYFLNLKRLNRILSDLKPDLLNIHYASGYGTLGMLANFQPKVLSVWGSDVYEFPEKTLIHKNLIQKNLDDADAVFSTSKTMADRVNNYLGYKKNVKVTPFGIDLKKFKPETRSKNDNLIRLGTVKKLEDKYGIDLLLRVFARVDILLKQQNTNLKDRVRYLIVGGGKEYENLKILSKKLGIENKVEFTGHIPHNDVVKQLNKLDLYFALSRSDSESFGVAILEASACSVPVIVSNKGGLWEVVDDKNTGFIVDIDDLDRIADLSIDLIKNDNLRKKLGKNGRKFVEENYSWEYCLKLMEKYYKQVITKQVDK